MSPTNWNWRTTVTTTYQTLRLWWAYLTNSLGEYIVTSLWERIICIIPGGDLPINSFTSRTWVSTSWVWRTLI